MQPNICLIDFETTGLTPGFHDPIQVAALLITPDLQEVSAFESLIRPANPQNASPEALAIHKKPMSQLLAAPTPREVMTQLKEGAQIAGIPYIAGFNVDFDLRFLAALEDSTGIRIERQASPILCAREIYLKAKGLDRYTKGTKLVDLCRLYGIQTDGAHDALADVRMTLKLLRRLRQDHPEAFAFLGGPVEVPAAAPEDPWEPEQEPLSIESLLRRLAAAEAFEVDAKADFEKALADMPEKLRLTSAQLEVAELRAAIRDLMTEPGKVETPAGTVSLVSARSVEYSPDDVRLFAPEVAALVIRQIPAREEVDRAALEKAVKAGMKAGTLAPDTLVKLESRATVKELTPRFIIKLADPAAPATLF